jgi:hypothetical protein
VLLLGACVAYGQTASATGGINGTVQTSDGKPAFRTLVKIHARPGAVAATYKPLDSVIFTGADGTFSLSGLPDGLYAVCPIPADTKHVDSCRWGTEPKATVSGGAITAAPTIQLQPGADLYVRVNDPNGTRAAKEGKVPGVSLMLAVRSPNGMMIPIPVTAVDSAGADQHIFVPTGTNLLFVAFSAGLSLTDGSGAAINQQTGKAITINIPVGQTQLKEVINVQ